MRISKFYIILTTMCSALSAHHLSGSDEAVPSPKRYITLHEFVSTILPEAPFTIWIPITAKNIHNPSRPLAFQGLGSKNKSSCISLELYEKIQSYRCMLAKTVDALHEQIVRLGHHPVDREAVLTRRHEINRYTEIINAYQAALTLLHTIKAPTATPSGGGSPIVRRFASHL
jgi:hypothetical protein